MNIEQAQPLHVFGVWDAILIAAVVVSVLAVCYDILSAAPWKLRWRPRWNLMTATALCMIGLIVAAWTVTILVVYLAVTL